MAKLCEHGYFLEVAPRSCPKCRTDLDLIQRDKIADLEDTISRLKKELREIDIAIADPESNLTKTQAECVQKMHKTISRLREYARHDPSCKSWGRIPCPCDCGYDALMADLGESK